VRTSEDGVPAVPRAGCFAEVEAPVGRGSEEADTAIVPEPALAVTVPETVTDDKGVNVDICAAVKTTGTEAAAVA
jgi:hypothetical protein